MATTNEPTLSPALPVLVAHLFPELLQELVVLLSALPPEDWRKPTTCSGWSVKDVVLHLLGGDVGNLSRRRDDPTLGFSVADPAELLAAINDWNQRWVQVNRRISTRLLIDLLQFVGEQICDYFGSLDPHAPGGPVTWAGSAPAPVWLDLAREYTERWHHQQHIRDAVDRPGLKEPRYLAPTLATFVRALPNALHGAAAPEHSVVALTITGESGGRWSAQRQGGTWALYAGSVAMPAAELIVDQESAWRLFTRGLSPAEARQRATLRGDPSLGERVLDMVSIIA